MITSRIRHEDVEATKWTTTMQIHDISKEKFNRYFNSEKLCWISWEIFWRKLTFHLLFTFVKYCSNSVSILFEHLGFGPFWSCLWKTLSIITNLLSSIFILILPLACSLNWPQPEIELSLLGKKNPVILVIFYFMYFIFVFSRNELIWLLCSQNIDRSYIYIYIYI